jgi:hypothetical protein
MLKNIKLPPTYKYYTIKSRVSKKLEVTWANGELVLTQKTQTIHMEVCTAYLKSVAYVLSV